MLPVAPPLSEHGTGRASRLAVTIVQGFVLAGVLPRARSAAGRPPRSAWNRRKYHRCAALAEQFLEAAAPARLTSAFVAGLLAFVSAATQCFRARQRTSVVDLYAAELVAHVLSARPLLGASPFAPYILAPFPKIFARYVSVCVPAPTLDTARHITVRAFSFVTGRFARVTITRLAASQNLPTCLAASWHRVQAGFPLLFQRCLPATTAGHFLGCECARLAFVRVAQFLANVIPAVQLLSAGALARIGKGRIFTANHHFLGLAAVTFLFYRRLARAALPVMAVLFAFVPLAVELLAADGIANEEGLSAALHGLRGSPAAAMPADHGCAKRARARMAEQSALVHAIILRQCSPANIAAGMRRVSAIPVRCLHFPAEAKVVLRHRLICVLTGRASPSVLCFG